MDLLKSWGITVCLAALAAGIAGIIAPTGKMEKIYKFAVSLFFLCCLLVPLFSLKNISLHGIRIGDSDSAASNGLSATVSEQAQSVAEQNVANLVESSCRSCGVVPVRIDVGIVNTGGQMSVRSVQVVLKPSDMHKKNIILETIKNRLGLSATVRAQAG